MIDREGYRLNVGIVLINDQGQVFWAKRRGMANAWQFPQGGMQENETPEQAMYRELTEELGLQASDVEMIRESRHWLKYRLPRQYRRKHVMPLCIGQKQKWFLLKLISSDQKILLDATVDPEFDQWRWVYYWYPIHHVIMFKQNVYRRVLKEFAQTVKSIIRQSNQDIDKLS